MAEFDSNPDIDEKPPIPLRDALEKMKPFLMAYENIQTEKEWQVSHHLKSVLTDLKRASIFSYSFHLDLFMVTFVCLIKST